MDSFFHRSGTLSSLLDFSNSYQAMKSPSAKERTSGLGGLVSLVLSLLGI